MNRINARVRRFNLPLGIIAVFLLHNPHAAMVFKHAAQTCCIGHAGCQQGQALGIVCVVLHQRGQNIRAHVQHHITIQHHNRALVLRQQRRTHLHGVASAPLLGLAHKFGAGEIGIAIRFHRFRAKARHHHRAGGLQWLQGRQQVPQHRSASKAVQHLGQGAFHPRALARR